MVRKELVSVLVLLLFVAVAHAQDSKGPGPSSSEKEKRGFSKEKSRAAKREAGRERLQLTPEEREERRKASALYAALVEPITPKEIAFPLSEEDAAKFHASREGLMESVRVDARNYDLSDDKVRKELRDKTTANQEAVRKLLVEAVNKGATLLQARTGLVIAQFEALPEKARADALTRAKERRDKSPKGNMERARERQQARHDKEKEQLAALDSDAAREQWVSKHYMPQGARLPRLLQDHDYKVGGPPSAQ